MSKVLQIAYSLLILILYSYFTHFSFAIHTKLIQIEREHATFGGGASGE
jgi:hypothetical protein